MIQAVNISQGFYELTLSFSSLLPACVHPVSIFFVNNLLCSTLSLSNNKAERATIRSFKYIFFKCKMMAYWNLGENNILSTNTTKLNKMGGEHGKD